MGPLTPSDRFAEAHDRWLDPPEDMTPSEIKELEEDWSERRHEAERKGEW